MTLESQWVMVSDAVLNPEYLEDLITTDIMFQCNIIQLLFYQLENISIDI